MDKFDKGKSPPIKIYYPISYVGLDEKKHIVEQQMGVALGRTASTAGSPGTWEIGGKKDK